MDYPYASNLGYQQAFGNPQQPAMYQYPMQQPRQQIPQQQMQQQMPQQQGIHGRVVNNETEILPSDVTSDGNWSWYPMSNGSYVVGRKMDSNFNVTQVRFVPEPQKAPEPTQSDRIEEKLNRLLSMLEPKTEEVVNDAE